MTTRAWLLLCVLSGLLGFALSGWLDDLARVEQVAHGEVRTAPNDVIPATDPGGGPSLPAPTDARGGTQGGVLEIRVAPPAVELTERRVGAVLCPAERVECPPLDLRVDLLTTADGQEYVAVRGPDGSEITGRFMPERFGQVMRVRRLTGIYVPGGDWALAGTRDWGRWSYGVAGGQFAGEPFVGLAGSVSW